jgi:ATP-dependent Lon protease
MEIIELSGYVAEEKLAISKVNFYFLNKIIKLSTKNKLLAFNSNI